MAYTPKYDYRAKDALPSGNTAKVIRGTELMEDFEKLGGIVDKLDSEAGTTKPFFASVTYDGTSIQGTPHNVQAVQWLNQPENQELKFARVTFESGIPNLPQQPNGTLDADLNIQVTPFSNANNSLGLAGVAAACITEITSDYVEIAFIQTDENLTWQFVFDQAFCLLVAEN
jgi:hypothetical protein